MGNEKFIEQGTVTVENFLDDMQPNYNDKPEEEPNTEAQKEAEAIPIQEPPAQVIIQSNEITMQGLKANIEGKVKKKKLEDVRKKASYWLDPVEIKMINDLAKATGKDKYEIVSFAIRELYKNLMG